MRFPSRSTRFVVIFGALVLLFTIGCGESVRGGGWLPSAFDPSTKANFGFHSDTTGDAGERSVHGTYHDQAAGVRLKFTGVVSVGWIGGATYTYESQDKKNPGSGTVFVDVSDGGDGVSETGNDYLNIVVQDGPYAGYQNAGIIQGGNIQHLDKKK